MRSFLVMLLLGLQFYLVVEAADALPDLSGSWALLQVIAEYWEAPLLGERLRRVIQTARIRIEQDGRSLQIWSEEVCSMSFSMGTALLQISVAPEFVRTIRVGPIAGEIQRDGEGFVLVIPPSVVLNGVQLAAPEDPLPSAPTDPRVLDPDSDGNPGFTVRVKVLGLFSGECYVVQRLRQEYRGRILSPDYVRGSILWQDEQVTLGASSPFFMVSGKGRPAPELAFFVLRRVTGREACSEVLALFAPDLPQ